MNRRTGARAATSLAILGAVAFLVGAYAPQIAQRDARSVSLASFDASRPIASLSDALLLGGVLLPALGGAWLIRSGRRRMAGGLLGSAAAGAFVLATPALVTIHVSPALGPSGVSLSEARYGLLLSSLAIVLLAASACVSLAPLEPRRTTGSRGLTLAIGWFGAWIVAGTAFPAASGTLSGAPRGDLSEPLVVWLGRSTTTAIVAASLVAATALWLRSDLRSELSELTTVLAGLTVLALATGIPLGWDLAAFLRAAVAGFVGAATASLAYAAVRAVRAGSTPGGIALIGAGAIVAGALLPAIFLGDGSDVGARLDPRVAWEGLVLAGLGEAPPILLIAGGILLLADRPARPRIAAGLFLGVATFTVFREVAILTFLSQDAGSLSPGSGLFAGLAGGLALGAASLGAGAQERRAGADAAAGGAEPPDPS